MLQNLGIYSYWRAPCNSKLWVGAKEADSFFFFFFLDYEFQNLVNLIFIFLQPDRQQANLWSPLANQGWKPCVDSADTPCELPQN